MNIKIGTQDKPFFPITILDKFKMIKEIGFDCYEIDGKLLLEKFEEIKVAIQETGLKVSSVCGGYQGWIGDFDEKRREACILDITNILEKLGDIGGKGIVVPAAWGMFSLRLPPMIPPRSSEDDKKVLLDSLKKLDLVAKKTGTTIYLEPLNRYEDHMLNTLDSVSNLIELGSFKFIKIMPDFFHMNIEEPSIRESIIKHKNKIDHIHVASSHRFQPGTGHIKYDEELRVLKDVKFEGEIILECRVSGNDFFEEYKKSLQYLKKCLDKIWG